MQYNSRLNANCSCFLRPNIPDTAYCTFPIAAPIPIPRNLPVDFAPECVSAAALA